MSATTETKTVLKGGEFLIKETSFENVFIKDEITEEQKMFGQTACDFVNNRVAPNFQKIEKQEHGVTVKLMEESGELGLLGASVPEEYGGMGVDVSTDTVINEEMGQAHSFAAAYAAHTGIGTLPIL